MVTGAILPSELTAVGIALQTDIGTGVDPTNFLRATDVKPQPNVPYLPDDSMLGDMAKVHDLIGGPTSTSFELDTNLYADELGWSLASLLGDLTVTGAGDPYMTVFALLNSDQGQTASYTLTDWNGSDATQYVDCKANELSLSYTADGLVTVSSKWDGISIASTTEPTFSYAATRAQPSWRAAVSINSLVGPLVTDLTVDLKRTNMAIAAMQSTAAQPVAAIFNGGDMDYTGTATVVFDATNGNTIYGYYKAGTVIPLQVDLNVTEGSAAHEVKFKSTETILTGASVQRASASYVSLAITFEGRANTTDAGASGGKSPVKATTKAQLAAGTYA